MFALKIRKIGKSMGIVLPKEALARLKVAEGSTPLYDRFKRRRFQVDGFKRKISRTDESGGADHA